MQEIDMKSVLHYMLKSAFIEIRASESINASKKIADVFHALPMALLTCTIDDEYQDEYFKLLEKSKQWGLDQYLEGLKAMAIKSIEESRGSG